MSSHPDKGSPRPLRAAERELIAALVGSDADQDLLVDLEHRLVKETDDGGMGSLFFVEEPEADRRFGAILAEGSFLDTDGVFVSVVLNVDTGGKLLELDIWKVDFSPLKRFPAATDVHIVERREQHGR